MASRMPLSRSRTSGMSAYAIALVLERLACERGVHAAAATWIYDEQQRVGQAVVVGRA